MRPKDLEFRAKNNQPELFRTAIKDFINTDRPLAAVGDAIDWIRFEKRFGDFFPSHTGKPATPTRVVVGLLYLKHTYNLSDDVVVKQFCENPYWQYFCGYRYFEDTPPCDASVLSRWRKKIGESGAELLLQEILSTAHRTKKLNPKDLEHVNIDTTVQEKNISFPTDAKLLNRAREKLVKEAKSAGIELRQSYTRLGKFHLVKYQRYCHAKQFKRAKKPLKKLKTFLARTIRDIGRKIENPSPSLQEKLKIARTILGQERHSKNKIYSVHEPHVECISKGKAHKRYEFGCKVSILTTNKSSWVIGVKACHGNPYDGHTIPEVLDQAKRIYGAYPRNCYLDQGYRGANSPKGVELFTTRMKRGISKKRRKLLRRRSAIEPVIGHTKHEHRLGRNFLKGIAGDKINPILAGAGKNMAKLVALFFVSKYFYENFAEFLGLMTPFL